MIRNKSAENDMLVLDLTGPQGNALVLLGYAKNLAKQLDLDGSAIIDEMKSGDFENLVQVFDSYFGDYVILER